MTARVKADEADLAPGEADALRGLGLALRAGRAVVGTRAVREAGRAERLELVVLARDAGENARARLRAATSGADVLQCGTRASLGAAVGRGPTVTVGVTDPGFARRIRREAAVREDGGASAGLTGRHDGEASRPRTAAAARDRESSEQEDRR